MLSILNLSLNIVYFETTDVIKVATITEAELWPSWPVLTTFRINQAEELTTQEDQGFQMPQHILHSWRERIRRHKSLMRM